MTELDLGLKVGVRRLLWSMGYSTRLDVELRGDRRAVASQTRRAGGPGQEESLKFARSADSNKAPETFTDLDVLGVVVAPGFQLSTIIADCKSGQRDKPTARMFWARGVADLFGADQVMLVREHDVLDATRQLSSRLGITVLPAADLAAMQRLHGSPVANPSGPLGLMFDRRAVEENLSAFTGLDRRLAPLLEYRQFDYWVYEHHRNPIQLVAHLRDSANRLDPRNPIHLALFVDLVWLYIVALVRVVAHIRGAFLQDPDRGLQEYIFGGATNLREKQETAALLRSVAPPGTPNLDHLPDYYGNLRELVTRLLRRPDEVQSALRYAEAASALMAARQRITLPEAFRESFNPIAAKLVADICGFLVASGGLKPDFRTQARAWLLGEPIATSQTAPRDRGAKSAHQGPGDPQSGLVSSDVEKEVEVVATQPNQPVEAMTPDESAGRPHDIAINDQDQGQLTLDTASNTDDQ